MSRFRLFKAVLVLGLAALSFSLPAVVPAQLMQTIVHVDTLLSIDVADTLGAPGHAVPVSILMQNLSDSIAGYAISITLSSPDLMQFSADTTIDTCFTCLDLPACTMLDTSICTLEVVPSLTTGTLVENWDFEKATTIAGLNIRLTGIADVDADEFPLPILPFTNGVLIKVVGRVNCDIEDTVVNRTIELQVNSNGTRFSNASAVSIPSTDSTFWLGAAIVDTATTGGTYDSLVIYKPVASIFDGSITVPIVNKGDMNADQTYNILDVVAMINIAFRAADPACPPSLPDVNCDGVVNVFDVVILINHVFRNGAPPFC